MEFSNTLDTLNPHTQAQIVYKKLTRMTTHQLEEEAQKFNWYAELSQIINCYLMIRKQPPEMKMEMIFDEKGWCIKYSNRMNLNFESSNDEDVKILKTVQS